MATTDFLVAGLGNPGREYQSTPHNAGFDVVDRLADGAGIGLRKGLRYSARLGRASIDGVNVCLMQPLTYMNRSGDAVAPWMRYHRLEIQQLIVIVDDIDRPLGTIRIRAGGSSGGHKGLQSMIDRLGSTDFVRLRIGVGRGKAADDDVVRHVLSPFSRLEKECFQRVLDQAAKAVRCLVAEGLDTAMNRFNGCRITMSDDAGQSDTGQQAIKNAESNDGRIDPGVRGR